MYTSIITVSAGIVAPILKDDQVIIDLVHLTVSNGIFVSGDEVAPTDLVHTRSVATEHLFPLHSDILSLNPKTAQYMIDYFAECSYCDRHTQNKPIHFENLTNSKPPKTVQKWYKCICTCRQNAREICRFFDVIHENDPEFRKEIEK